MDFKLPPLNTSIVAPEIGEENPTTNEPARKKRKKKKKKQKV